MINQAEFKKFGLTDLFMVMALLLWAVNFSLVKIALIEFTPLAFNGIRLVFASACLMIFLLLSGERFAIQRNQILPFIGLGLVGNTIYQMMFIFGIDRTTASNSAIIIASAPILIAILSLCMKHESLHYAAWIGIVISFAGLYFVVSSRHGAVQFSGQSFVGDILIFCGNVSWAFYTVFSKPYLSRISPLKLTAWTMSLGTVFYVPFCIPDLLTASYSQISLKAWAILLYSGLFSLGICYVIWYSSVRRVGNSRTSVYDNILPVFTVIFAFFLLGERLTLFQAVGTLIIFLGVYLTRSGYKWFIRNDREILK